MRFSLAQLLFSFSAWTAGLGLWRSLHLAFAVLYIMLSLALLFQFGLIRLLLADERDEPIDDRST